MISDKSNQLGVRVSWPPRDGEDVPCARARFGIHWHWSAYTHMGPVKPCGRTYYVTDNFGQLVHIEKDKINLSLKD